MSEGSISVTEAEYSTSVADAWLGGDASLSGSLRAYRVCACMVGVVGVLSNGLVFLIMVTHSRLRQLLSTVLIANQCLVDLVCGLSLVLTYAYKSIMPLTYFRGLGREVLCWLLHNELLLFCALNASTYCLMVITLERYLMIVAPIYHRTSFTKTKAVMLALLAWLAGFTWNGVQMGVTTYISKSSGACVIYNYPSYHVQQVLGYVYITATFLVPMLVFGLAYAHMFLVLRRRARRVGALSELPEQAGSQQSSTLRVGATAQGAAQKNTMNRAQMNLTKTMVLVTVAFALCWTPNQTHYLLVNTGALAEWGGEPYTVTLFMAFLNCCINPFIYAVKYKSFRSVLREKLGHKG